jgi:hypothetical protein
LVEQSYVSDELTHFVGAALKENPAEQYTLLLKILRERWLRSSYRKELGPDIKMLSNSQTRLSTNQAIKCTMVCFCDIPREQLKIHTQKYGSFGNLCFSPASADKLPNLLASTNDKPRFHKAIEDGSPG